MKKVKWIIDKDMFEDYENKLVDSIKNSGSDVYFYDDQKRTNIFSFLKKFDENDIIIFHGSLQHGIRLNTTKYYPGIYLTLENYECSKYYGYFGNYLLNSNYIMMGLNDILRNKEKIFNWVKTDSIFIRPSNGYKSFPGQLLPSKNFEYEFNVMVNSYGGLDKDNLCVISPFIEIDKEYRFIVIDGKVISGSLYMDKINRESWLAYYNRLCEDKEAFKFAENMVELYKPDKMYTIDICVLPSGEYKLIEINSFCCASMYGNDYDKIVDAVNKCCIFDFYETMNLDEQP